MSRRPSAPSAGNGDCGELRHEEVNEVIDPDPTANFPQWSRSLLILLDYAIIEGLQRGMHEFVQHLKLAETKLTEAAAEEERKARLAKRH